MEKQKENSMKKIGILLGIILLMTSCTQIEIIFRKLDTSKIESIAEGAAEEIGEEIVKDETGIDLGAQK
jgi:hypothetical protein